MNSVLSQAAMLHQEGRLAEAEKLYRKVLAEEANYDALRLLGVMATQNGRYGEAEELIKLAIKVDDTNQLGYIDLAKLYQKMGVFDRHKKYQEIECYQKALELDSSNSDFLVTIAYIYFELGDNDKAEEYFRLMLEEYPDCSNSYNSFGVFVDTLGRSQEAAGYFSKAIELDPANYGAHCNYSYIREYQDHNDEHLQMLLSHYQIGDLSNQELYYLEYALANAYSSIGDDEKFLEYLSKANQHRKDFIGYQVDEDLAEMQQIAQIFTQEFYQSIRSKVDIVEHDLTPVFIVGMPRSGSSLVEQILASHNSIYAVGELGVLTQSLIGLGNSEQIGSVTGFYRHLSQSSGEDLNYLAEQYLNNLRSLFAHDANQITYVTDKWLMNYIFIGIIKLIMPQAKIIHCLRDPMATGFSAYKHLFTQGCNYTLDLNDIAAYYNAYRGLMEHWHNIFPGDIYDLQYEDLVMNQESVTRELLEYCGLEWDETCLEFYMQDRVVNTASSAQVKKPIYKGSIDSWKRYEKFLTILKDNIEPKYLRL